jgi:hypothetical protein
VSDSSYWSFLQVTTHSPAVTLAEATPPAHGLNGWRPLQAHPLLDASGLVASGHLSATLLALCDVGLQINMHCLRSIINCRMPCTQTLSS